MALIWAIVNYSEFSLIWQQWGSINFYFREKTFSWRNHQTVPRKITELFQRTVHLPTLAVQIIGSISVMISWSPRGGRKVSFSASGSVEKVVDYVEEEDEEPQQSQNGVGVYYRGAENKFLNIFVS